MSVKNNTLYIKQHCTVAQPVLHDWCNKGRGMCYPVCVMGAYKRTLAANRKE